MASTPVYPPVLEVLNHHNYRNWRSRVKAYLLAEDLWEVVEAMVEPAKLEAEYKAWTKKNAKALYAIQNSCGPEMFPFIRETKTAKSAWEVLKRVSKLTGHVEISAENFKPYLPFTKFVREGSWDKAKEYCLRLGELDLRCGLRELDLHSAIRAIDPRDQFKDIALHVAARNGHVHIVKELVVLMTQEDLKMKNVQGYTALHVAALNGQVLTVKELVLLMGEERDSNGYTALHIAVNEGKVDIVKVLVQFMRQEDLKIKTNDGYTALHLAVNKKNVAMVKLLIGLMGKVKDDNGDTALHIAVKNQQLEIVKELVQFMRREDLKIKNDDGYTALHLAVNKGNMPIVKVFVTKKEGENKIAEDDFDRYVSFTTYVTNGDWDNAKECLRELHDPCDAIRARDPRDEYGNTALHAVTREGHTHIVKQLVLLIKVREEDLKLKTAQDFTAFGSDINLGISEQFVMERAKYMVEHYDKMLSSILDIQNAEGSTALHIAVLEGNVAIVKELVLLMRQEGLEIKDAHGDTPLHIAVKNENVDIVKELVPLMRQEAMEIKNGEGYTALGYAMNVVKDKDVMEMAKYMAQKNKKVFGIPTPPHNWIPVVRALRLSKWELARYLYSSTPLEVLNGIDGSVFICICLYTSKEIDLAWDLLQRFPNLAFAITESTKTSPMLTLARMSYAFLSGTQLTRWQRWIYNRTYIREVAHVNIHDDISIDVAKSEDNCGIKRDFVSLVMSLFRRFVKDLHKLCGCHHIYETKSTHKWIFEFLRCMGEATRNDNLTPDQHNMVRKSIFKAIEQGHFEFVTHICKANPELLDLEDEKGRTIFHFAIENRQKEIYSLIYELEDKQRIEIGISLENMDNTLLHYAANLSSLPQFDYIQDASLQMQRELQWFKEVESVVPSEMHERRNRSDDMTARELFTKNHKKLMEDAENSIKGTATSCTVVGALIVTMMFAVAFSVPGGNNGNTGLPFFLDKKLFKVFIVSDTISLVSSTTSVITFLGILTSRYAEDDFLKSLPTKIMIGLITLFLAVTTMMIAFSCALVIMFDGDAWIISLTVLFASVPIISFIWFLFPLLVEILMSTYGHGIFDRQVKP